MRAIIVLFPTNDDTTEAASRADQQQNKQIWWNDVEKKKRRIYKKNSNNEMEWRKITFPMGHGMPVVDLHMLAYLQTTHEKRRKELCWSRDPKHDKIVPETK